MGSTHVHPVPGVTPKYSPAALPYTSQYITFGVLMPSGPHSMPMPRVEWVMIELVRMGELYQKQYTPPPEGRSCG